MIDATHEEGAASALGPYRTDAAPQTKARGLPRHLRPRELVALLATIVLADVACFSGNEFGGGGFGLALIFSVAPLAMLSSATRFRRSRGLLLVASLLGLVALRSAVSPTVLTTLVGLLLLFVCAVALRFRDPSSFEVLGSAAQTFSVLPMRIAAVARGLRALLERTALGQGSLTRWGIPLLLCLVFLPVLASANAALGDALAWLAERAVLLGVPSAARIVWWALAFLLGLVLVRPSLMPRRHSDLAPVSLAFQEHPRVVAHNSLLALNALFLAFIVLDVAVLVTGHAPERQHTQEYAHQGAFWLTIALGMLTAVIGVMFHGPLAHDPSAMRTRQLAFAWIVQGLALALCTYGRIAIHVHSSGLSNLRIVGILGTTLVVVGMLLVGRKLHARRSVTWLLRRQMDAFVVMLTLFAVLPTHYLGARFNVARALDGAYAPLIHMGPQALEAEAVTQLLPLAQHPDPQVRHGAASLLLARLADLRYVAASRQGFQEHDVLLPVALDALSQAEPLLRAQLDHTRPEDADLLSRMGYGALLHPGR